MALPFGVSLSKLKVVGLACSREIRADVARAML